MRQEQAVLRTSYREGSRLDLSAPLWTAANADLSLPNQSMRAHFPSLNRLMRVDDVVFGELAWMLVFV